MNIVAKGGFLAFMLLFVVGCSQAPLATSFEMTPQQTVQSVQHWDVLAEDVAEQIKLGLTARNAMDRYAYLERKDESPFSEGFQNMLTTKLFNKGVKVIAVKDARALKVSYSAQVVYHKEPLKQPRSGKLALLTGAVMVVREAFEQPWSVAGRIAVVGGVLAGADLLDDALPGFWNPKGPNTEIILTTSVLDGNQYLMRKTDCYYVKFADSWHYNDDSPSKTIKIVN